MDSSAGTRRLLVGACQYFQGGRAFNISDLELTHVVEMSDLSFLKIIYSWPKDSYLWLRLRLNTSTVPYWITTSSLPIRIVVHNLELASTGHYTHFSPASAQLIWSHINLALVLSKCGLILLRKYNNGLPKLGYEYLYNALTTESHMGGSLSFWKSCRDIVPLEDAALGDRTLRGCKDIFRIEDEALENRNFEKIEVVEAFS